MKLAICALSILNVAAGLGLLMLYASESSTYLLLLGLALLVQGFYTVAFVSGALSSHRDIARHLQLGGSILALVVGSIGFVAGFLANVDPVNADPEYGPMTISLLVATHGFASLLVFTPWGILKTHTS